MSKTIIPSIVISLGFIIGLAIIGNAYKNRNKSEDTISVTGLGTKTFTSDLITWSGSFSRNSMELNSAYNQLSEDRTVIQNYLTSKGIAENEIIFSAVDIQKTYDYTYDHMGRGQNVFTGYRLNQSISIESKEVEKVEQLSRNITEIINQGIEFTSSPPNYFYTKLRSEEHTSELQSRGHLVYRLLLEKK